MSKAELDDDVTEDGVRRGPLRRTTELHLDLNARYRSLGRDKLTDVMYSYQAWQVWQIERQSQRSGQSDSQGRKLLPIELLTEPFLTSSIGQLT